MCSSHGLFHTGHDNQSHNRCVPSWSRSNTWAKTNRLPAGPVQNNDARETKAYACMQHCKPSSTWCSRPQTSWDCFRKWYNLEASSRCNHYSGDWSRLSGTLYKAVSDQWWVLGRLIMRGNRIVMPESLWKQTITLAHEGHQGMVRIKARLRGKVWWPRMDKQVEQLIKACYPCQLVGPRSKPEPVRSTTPPEGPWSDIDIDLSWNTWKPPASSNRQLLPIA